MIVMHEICAKQLLPPFPTPVRVGVVGVGGLVMCSLRGNPGKPGCGLWQTQSFGLAGSSGRAARLAGEMLPEECEHFRADFAFPGQGAVAASFDADNVGEDPGLS